MIGQTVSHYRILEKLGGGGMGVVYKAEDTNLKRIVALKFLPPEWMRDEDAKSRFTHEAQAASALDHLNICTIYEIDSTADGQMFIAMAFYQGESLKRKIDRGPLEARKAADLAAQIATGLSKAHEKGIIHRDVKPANVMVTDDGVAKIVDFGLAKAAGATVITKADTSLGTATYMSPEQTRGNGVDHRTDIWAMGAVLYEMLTGAPPFKGDYEQAVIYSILNEEPEEMPGVDPELAAIAMKALSKNPDDRYQSAEGIAIELRAFAGKESGRASTAEKRSKLPWLIAAATVLATLWYLTTLDKQSTSTPSIVSTRPLTSLPGMETSPTWAPDGSRIAYVSDEAGNLDVFVHHIVSHQKVNITQDHSGEDWHPVWSPDGEWIAFYSNRDGGGLYLAPAIGASARRILDVSGGLNLESGLAWAPDGSQLGLSIGDELFRVPARGGDAEEVVLPSEIVRLAIIDLSWTPGGDRLTFVARAAAFLSTSTIWSVRPDGSDAIRLTSGSSFDRHPVWSRDGSGLHFVSDRGGSPDLWFLPVGADGRPEGKPTTLTIGAGVGTFALSDNGRHIAYSKQIERSNIWSMPILERLVTMDDARRETDENHFIELLALSPDRKEIAFDSDRSGNADIWTIGVDGEGLRQISDDPAHDWAPRWSPDGRSIGYHSLRTGNRDLWVQPVQGGTPVQLTDHDAEDWTISWSPDGETIVFGSGRSGAVQLWRMPAAGGEAHQLTTIGDVWWYPVWSPDGSLIAISSDTSGFAEIYLVSVEDGQIRQLTNNRWQKGFPIAFSSDGTVLYACANTRPGLERLDIWAIALADGATRRITDFSGTRHQLFNATTDGTRIYATFMERIGDLWIVDVEHEGF